MEQVHYDGENFVLKSKAGYMRTSRVTEMEVFVSFFFPSESKAENMRTSRVTEMEIEKKTEKRNLKKEKIMKHSKHSRFYMKKKGQQTGVLVTHVLIVKEAYYTSTRGLLQ